MCTATGPQACTATGLQALHPSAINDVDLNPVDGPGRVVICRHWFNKIEHARFDCRLVISPKGHSTFSTMLGSGREINRVVLWTILFGLESPISWAYFMNGGQLKLNPGCQQPKFSQSLGDLMISRTLKFALIANRLVEHVTDLGPHANVTST
ncbi:hypothetical protein K435DRAFT_792006 [Dendrothele bispora CBS 962.96]|uniref:Uncharacterized protein n=1 Tax=Dendrothele bispora (strain CBS 962.96) TaxID=1314807 RepID=A0A4S8MK16_DENBC|nr:hypothetical protein K435DRAFT_792006 [Dendrothele bispora CBS 962.96]